MAIFGNHFWSATAPFVLVTASVAAVVGVVCYPYADFESDQHHCTIPPPPAPNLSGVQTIQIEFPDSLRVCLPETEAETNRSAEPSTSAPPAAVKTLGREPISPLARPTTQIHVE